MRFGRTLGPALFVVLGGVLCLVGCSHEPPASVSCAELLVPTPEMSQGEVFSVPGNCGWVASELTVQAGETITVTAQGCVQFREEAFCDRERPSQTGPEGLYLYDDDVAFKQFPLPSAAEGPAPCYCLIGRIGDGPAFFVGRAKSWVAKNSGRLYLGVNDFDLSDNTGEFVVSLSQPDQPQPVALPEVISSETNPGSPVAGAQVVVFYVDGLRPDVIQEMAAMGHLPHIRSLFLDGGCWLKNTFTAFPSDTITSNGTMWTGCFSDRHGLKGQVRFSRRTLHSESYLEPLGPNRSARLLSPQCTDKVVHKSKAKTVGLFHGDEAKQEYLMSNSSNVPPLFAHLRNHGGDWATGALPMMTEIPPVLWSRSLVHEMPCFHMHEAWKYIDDANTHYARWHLIDNEKPVTVIWLPETDSVSHKKSRGQFGLTRRTIARADRLIGQVVDQLRKRNRLCRTYFVLVSDHGHHGGRNTHLSHYDLANQFFFHPRELSRDGHWVGGGLGLSVRQHRTWNKHPEDSGREFVFIDGDSDGAARIFLPRGCYHSHDWQAAYRPADILAYQIAPHLPPVNLVESVLRVKAIHGSGYEEHPVDLALMRLSDCSILVSTVDRGHAVIDRQKRDDGKWWYRYTVVENVVPASNGEVCYTPVLNPGCDPLGLLQFFTAEQLAGYYDERSWLKMTTPTRYPDSVVTLTRHLLWQENLVYREREYAADLVVTARPGWFFGKDATKGTTHGYPLADAMRATFFLSGPNIRRGAWIEEPGRLADLTPTILEMTGTPYNPSEMDGQAWQMIYEPDEICETPVPQAPLQAVFWEDIDLQAWHPLHYREREPYAYLPKSINRPSSRLDLNNIAYNALSVMDINPWRVADYLVCPITKRKRCVSGFVDRLDRSSRDRCREWFAGAVGVMDVPGLVIWDYNLTSVGNLKRADRAVDWLQDRNQNLHQKIARRTNRSHFPGHLFWHDLVDGTQETFWDVFRFSQRVLVKVLDETVLNSLENGVDRAINHFHKIPAEVIVD